MLGLTTADSQSQTATGSTSPPSSKTNGSKRPTGRLNTISKRNLAAAHDSETLLWRAVTDEPEAVLEYVADDCVMINPVSFGNQDPVAGKSDIEEAIKHGIHFHSYRIHTDTFQVIEVGLMAVATMYHVTLYRHTDKGQEQVEALGSSVWRQTAGADWILCSQLVAYAD
jgi:ketosteroid isomerase-like protein